LHDTLAMPDNALELIDFHCHHVPPDFTLNPLGASDRPKWEGIRRKLIDRAALVRAIDDGDVNSRVINIPTEQFTAPGERQPIAAIRRINDELAEIVGLNPGRLHGLATIDAFSGDVGAEEVSRARLHHGLRGIFVESASGDLLLDAPEARPTLEAAAALGMPVFVHPVSQPALSDRLARYGRLGSQLARGNVNAATLVALLESGTLDELPDLQVVVTTLAIGGVLLAAGLGERPRLRQDASALLRRHVYIDTMGFDPALIRVCADLLGADHVLLGSDWPIHHAPIRERAERGLHLSGLDATAQALIANGNARRLLALGEALTQRSPLARSTN
jgi:aminocarboxymuconate-semialdehyde decarboxylase